MQTGWKYRDDGSREFYLHGTRVSQAEFDAAVPSKAIQAGAVQRHGDAFRCIESDSLGVHPDQVPEATAYAAKSGFAVEYKPDGTALFRSRKALERMSYAHEFGIGKQEREGKRR